MSIVSVEDINYLADQSTGKINMILSGMTALMNDTDNKVEMMQSQTWFQRMAKTITGKNKVTQLEVQQNHDKLNAYMSEAIAELYNRNCIDHEIMMSLGMQLNELYADHVQLKQMLGAFVGKLNEKIDSVDNFHMLTTEISQKVYSNQVSIISICKVLSQFDTRILEDNRKLGIIKRSLEVEQIINDKEINVRDYMLNIIDLSMDEVGQVYLELSTIKGSFMSNVLLGIIENYHFLPDVQRKMKNKQSIVDEMIKKEGVERDVTLSINEIYEEFVNNKIDVKNGLVPIAEIQFELKVKEAEELFLNYKLEEAYVLFESLAEKGNARAMFFMGEYHRHGYGKIAYDSIQGQEWHSKGAELGEILCEMNVAYGLPKESNERKEIFSRTFLGVLQRAEMGDVFAQNEVGDLYKNGYGVEIDIEKSIEWMMKSAEQGYWRSIGKLPNYINENNYQKVIECCQKGIQLDYPDAMNDMAIIYHQGEWVEENHEAAFKLLQKAAELGNNSAMRNLGLSYRYGWGIEVDFDNAIIWYKKAAEAGHKLAQRDLGDIFYDGEITKQDYSAAIYWYKKAGKQTDGKAANKVGLMYWHGKGVTKNEKKANKWFEIAANNGHVYGADNLAKSYYDGRGVEQDYTEAIRWYKRAAELQLAESANAVGYMYYKGYGVDKDIDEAIKWAEKAGDMGHAYGYFNAGKMYEEYEDEKISWDKRMLYYQKAMDLGMSEAARAIETMFEKKARQLSIFDRKGFRDEELSFF